MFVYEKVYTKDVLEAIYVPKELESDDDASLLRSSQTIYYWK